MSKNTRIFATVFIITITAILLFANPFKSTGFDLAEVEKANDLAKQWIFKNLQDDGLFVYTHNPAANEYSDNNNTIRQLMTSRVLALESQTDPELTPLHERNIESVFDQWYQEDGENGYVLFGKRSKLGANAMLLRVLLYSPMYEEYAEEARALYNGIKSLQDESGAFRAWYVEPDYEYNEAYLLTFYSGEALLALVEYYEKTQDEDVLKATLRSANFYLEEYVEDIDQNYYPAYVPWHTIALNRLYKITSDQRYIDAIFILNDKLIDEMLDRQFDNVGRFYNPQFEQYGTPHSSSDAVYTEGVAYALEIAELVNDTEHIEKYRDALNLAVPHLISLQYQEPIERFVAAPETYVGAFHIRDNSSWTRTDTTQHAVDALTKVLEVW